MSNPDGREHGNRMGNAAEVAWDVNRVRKYITYSAIVWIVGSVIGLTSAVVGALLIQDATLTGILVGISAVQTVLAIPAAIVLHRTHANWARILLWILALLSIASLYQSLKAGAWPSLILNLVLGSTLGTLSDRHVRDACRYRTR
ncbi:hypothetical protein [Sciscionella sediminilitoris]|uniref:hypothetical protein n=1 Tax=Sciscionella sediminilitoris TaxID=1445613 RepID=UPI0012E13EC8|nr:hypothetical protein [Sciscionella sp. SE31]